MIQSVEEFYKDKTIFVTGGSGYMGKVLVEKLLYSCSNLKQIILLMRQKRGKTGEMRVKEFEMMSIFERIMNEKPEVMKKIYPVWGDISEPYFGLSTEHMNYVVENTQIVFHLAASLKLEAPLKTNVTMNLEAVKTMCDIAKQMKNLILMIHTSTAFCIVEHSDIDEKVYDVDEDPYELIERASKMTEKELAKVDLGKHINSYTYTKRLSEILVRNEFNKFNLPVCIVRPSMVHPAFAEPKLGWVDSLNGAPGVVIAAGRGVLRCLFMDKDGTKNFIPVDTCMNAYIMIAKHLGTSVDKPTEIPVFNLTAHESNTITLGKYADIADEMKSVYPLSFGIWYPKLELSTNPYYYYPCIFLFQWIPALLIDFLFLVFGQKRFMIKVQKKLYTGINVMRCFLLSRDRFATKNFESLIKIQSDEEYKTFFIDTKKINAIQYFKNTMMGGRIYLAKDPLKTIPKAKIIFKIQYIIHITTRLFIGYWIINKLLNYISLMDPLMAVVEKVKPF